MSQLNIVEYTRKSVASPRMLTVIRGAQGSGKSTLAKRYSNDNTVVLETDDFFTFGDKYIYDKDYGKECYRTFLQRLELILQRTDFNVVVTGVFSTELALKPLMEIINDADVNLTVIKATGMFKNVHDVPEDIVETARTVFLPFQRFIEIYN